MKIMIRILMVIFVLALIAMPVSQTKAQETQSGLTLTSPTKTAAQTQAILTFWTKARISNAQPFPMPVDTGSSLPSFSIKAGSSASGPAGMAKAGPAAANADALAKSAYPSEWVTTDQSTPDGSLALDQVDGTSSVFTSYTVNSWVSAQTVYPHKWVGRLSFTTAGGTSYCSATAISNNHFVTAAHCVYDTTNDVWYSNWVFTPAYRLGAAPYGSFAATSCTILTAWVNLVGGYSIAGWAKYDVAVCAVGANTAGTTLNNAVGWAGRAWNNSYTVNVFNMGYPWQYYNLQSIPTTAGGYLRTCTAETFAYTTDTLGSGCLWGPGISGGPWLLNYAVPSVSGNVNSVNSGLFANQKNLYGIRFTDQNIVLVCNAQGC